MKMRALYFPIAGLLIIAGAAGPAAAALGPEQIVLIVNSKVPASRELAEFYAEKRQVPADHILALDLPFPQEEMPFERYNSEVAPQVRDFLRRKGLDKSVTCLVTFYGVPLRVGRKTTGPAENEQIGLLDREINRSGAEIVAALQSAEALAKEIDPKFQPARGAQLEQLGQRAGAATTAALRGIGREPQLDRKRTQFARLLPLIEQLAGRAETLEKFAQPDLAKLAPKAVSPQELNQSRRNVAELQKEFNRLQGGPPDAQSFEKMRAIVKENFGLFRYVSLLAAQKGFYDPTDTESAFDSELAMAYWDKYPRVRWQINTRNFKVRNVPAHAPPVLMVMRLDAPKEQTVRRMIIASIETEKKGLAGRVALDARGKTGNDGYGQYDQSIRRLAGLVRTKTKLELSFDDTEMLFQPGTGAMKDVSLYCGWYSLRNYVPAFGFAPGAVGFHVASSELVSLRGENEKGWVAGLLNDGVAVSLGPVAEPYLHAFPPADEFFGLLMTGKLTLAEVYWKTNPLTSWMNTCVGDPLYTPFKNRPALAVEDLPPALQAALRPIPPQPAPASPGAAPGLSPPPADGPVIPPPPGEVERRREGGADRPSGPPSAPRRG